MKKIVTLILVLAMVMAIAAPALAASGTFTNKNVYGGASQVIAYGYRDEPNSMDLSVSSITWRGQTEFKFRGYDYSTGLPCTQLKTITGTGYYMATYTTSAYDIDMVASIASSSTSDYLTFSGSYYI